MLYACSDIYRDLQQYRVDGLTEWQGLRLQAIQLLQGRHQRLTQFIGLPHYHTQPHVTFNQSINQYFNLQSAIANEHLEAWAISASSKEVTFLSMLVCQLAVFLKYYSTNFHKIWWKGSTRDMKDTIIFGW